MKIQFIWNSEHYHNGIIITTQQDSGCSEKMGVTHCRICKNIRLGSGEVPAWVFL